MWETDKRWSAEKASKHNEAAGIVEGGGSTVFWGSYSKREDFAKILHALISYLGRSESCFLYSGLDVRRTLFLWVNSTDQNLCGWPQLGPFLLRNNIFSFLWLSIHHRQLLRVHRHPACVPVCPTPCNWDLMHASHVLTNCQRMFSYFSILFKSHAYMHMCVCL